jgi:hypothetical protein
VLLRGASVSARGAREDAMTHEEHLLMIASRSMPERIAQASAYFLMGEHWWRMHERFGHAPSRCDARSEAIEFTQFARDILAQCVTDLDGLIETMKEPKP